MIKTQIPEALRPYIQGTSDPLPWIWLVEATLGEAEGGVAIKTRIASVPRDIEFGGRTYGGGNFALGTIEIDSEGSLEAFALAFSNANRMASRFVQVGGGLAGREASLYLTHERLLASSQFVMHSTHRMGPVTITDEFVSVPLQDPQLLNELFPIDRFMRERCTYPTFGDSVQCIYQGTGYTTCPRTPDACNARGDDEAANGRIKQHPARADFYPGLSNIRW